ncbi:aminoglycoside phosphotransferase family protein [Methylovulum psychrotolerans]|uniref:phosphotransferase enzyme family protein n=1 Tax=Methylovulum psychrotolerans TaxID=1704499 RepID=UPI001BFF36F2|nr:aminoglycoside phosphotransferase family protein [Methylovulum psychrotolerans]MBT9098779.1 aminoglycoside phosphotransferase family protein [Methylovulum psychrotolerans]
MTTETSLPHHIARQFDASACALAPLGNGLINDTFLVSTTDGRHFVLQRINQQVFPQPLLINANLSVLSKHIRQQPGARLQIPAIVYTAAGESHVQDSQGGLWRAQSFIANTQSLESLRNLDDARQTGYALGHFHRLLSNLNPLSLHDTLPGFHITPTYLNHYHNISSQTCGTDPFCADFISNFQDRADRLETAQQQGRLYLRVIHGDPKLNNFLFAKDTASIVSLIDLDTVKPGLVHYDIGDCLRSCCHDPVTDHFNLDIGAAILTGYLSEAGAFFSPDDYAYLYAAIELLPFELGLRFYTDYLQGNRYFKVSAPEQNLHRAQAQFRLCASVTAQQAALSALIKQLTPDKATLD